MHYLPRIVRLFAEAAHELLLILTRDVLKAAVYQRVDASITSYLAVFHTHMRLPQGVTGLQEPE
jgi:hypothetical protein